VGSSSGDYEIGVFKFYRSVIVYYGVL
jgi:hypothetical protein